MKTRDDLIEEIAREFSAELTKEIGREKVEEIVNTNELLNQKVTRSDEMFCSSHDHCDANAIMLDAFRKIMKRAPLFLLDEADVDQSLRDEEMTMLNDAWTMASKNKFYLPVKSETEEILEYAEVYLHGYISEYGFMLLTDIREKAEAATWNEKATVVLLKDDHSMSNTKAEVLVAWAFSVMREKR